jgi:hypothetical protein
MTDNTFYVIDSSSLIDMKLYYRMSSFKTLWERCNELIRQGRLAAPVAVLEELEHKSDELTEWAQGQSEAFFYPDSEYSLKQVGLILARFPNLIDPNREHEQADPFVIALALDKRDGPQQTFEQYEVCVVTEERVDLRRTGKVRKTKIPEVCEFFKIHCFSMVDMIEREGWEF